MTGATEVLFPWVVPFPAAPDEGLTLLLLF